MGGGSSPERHPCPRLAVKVNPISTLVVLGIPLSLARVAVGEEQATQERSSGGDMEVLSLLLGREMSFIGNVFKHLVDHWWHWVQRFLNLWEVEPLLRKCVMEGTLGGRILTEEVCLGGTLGCGALLEEVN